MTPEHFLQEAERLAQLKGIRQDADLSVPYELMEQSYRTLAANASLLVAQLRAVHLAMSGDDAEPSPQDSRLAG